MIVRKTLKLYDEGGGLVGSIDAEWLYNGESYALLRLDSPDWLMAEIERHVKTWIVPDDADLAGARWARMEAAE